MEKYKSKNHKHSNYFLSFKTSVFNILNYFRNQIKIQFRHYQKIKNIENEKIMIPNIKRAFNCLFIQVLIIIMTFVIDSLIKMDLSLTTYLVMSGIIITTLLSFLWLKKTIEI